MNFKKILILLIIPWSLFAQIIEPDFGFELYFEDALGYKDTLYLGADFEFREVKRKEYGMVDIKNIPLNRNFDVRYADLIYVKSAEQFKRSIVAYNCHYDTLKGPIRGMPFPHRLGFHTSQLPVTMRWDKSKFVDTCYNKTFLTRIDWSSFDFWQPSQLFTPHAYLAEVDSFVFTQEFLNKTNYGHIADSRTNYHKIFLSDSTETTWYQFYIGITNQALTILLGNEDTKLSMDQIQFQNPVHSDLIINIDELRENYSQLTLLTSGGSVLHRQKITEDQSNIRLSMHEYSSGMYYLAIYSKNQKPIIAKILKM